MADTETTARGAPALPVRLPEEGRRRVVIENVEPCIDGGRFPAKRVTGERVVVEADCFADGHDLLRCQLHFTHEDDEPHARRTLDMRPLGNDRWRAAFEVERLGCYRYEVSAAVDRFATWIRDLEAKHEAGQSVALELRQGAQLLEEAAQRADEAEAEELRALGRRLRSRASLESRVRAALSDRLAALMRRWAPRRWEVRCEPLRVVVDPLRARFSSWYEMFPRSASPDPDRSGTLRDVEARLPYVADMGFDVLYLPPIHPIGRRYRKGPNNALRAAPGDPGSPWAIGGREGGHKSIHPDLGTFADFDRLVAAARRRGIEIALDIAFQCSPDHPYVQEHPEWFRHRSDGSIQYAENPPKKYQDIYPFDFECEAWESLWLELRDVFLFWIGHGVTIFRVDNPHTKSFPFWEWVIDEVKREHREVVFLSEAFTRPKVMYRLAKLGFAQSYTYFAWRNYPWELRQYFEELTEAPVVDFFRANAWPNTPDILTEYLQQGGRPAAAIRLILAATLAANYGIYGPPFELVETSPREAGSEEYLHSEKYQQRTWDLDDPDSLRPLVRRVNRIRRENPALQQDRTLVFHAVDNPNLLAYSKTDPKTLSSVLCVVNTNPYAVEAGTLHVDLTAIEAPEDEPYQMHDLLTGAHYMWTGAHQYVRLDPSVMPAHVLRVRRITRTEQDFEYYL